MTSKAADIRIDDLNRSVGDESLVGTLLTFARPLNHEVEDFLKPKTRPATRLNSSLTYLIIDEDAEILSCFTLVMKQFTVLDEISPPRTDGRFLALTKNAPLRCFVKNAS